MLSPPLLAGVKERAEAQEITFCRLRGPAPRAVASVIRGGVAPPSPNDTMHMSPGERTFHPTLSFARKTLSLGQGDGASLLGEGSPAFWDSPSPRDRSSSKKDVRAAMPETSTCPAVPSSSLLGGSNPHSVNSHGVAKTFSCGCIRASYKHCLQKAHGLLLRQPTEEQVLFIYGLYYN